ncbi:MAG: GNAT family N-acetyltransferase [Anaerolineae bacterium]|nr:GNAT family N-acetyltransferase [Anaerolineae bacterium]MDQ7036119.1 GNAT family N-acetyltransferase [Anaerolineae bacterium]
MHYTYRPINLDTDFDTYYAMYRTEYLEKYGSFNMSENEVRNEFNSPEFDINQDTQVAFTDDGRIAGYAAIFADYELPVRPRLFAYVMPEHRGQGIGTKLTKWGIKRAKAVFECVPNDARVVLQSWALLDDEMQLLENMGYIHIRQSLYMKIEFDTAPAEVKFPETMNLVTFAEHPHLEDFARIQQASFHDHRGFVAQPLEKVVEVWQSHIDAAQEFIPEWVLMLKDSTKDVSMVFAWSFSEEEADRAYIEFIGVMPDYRRRGLGMKLLQHIFSEIYKRGIHKAALSVDGASLTGAVQLYEKAGMYIAHTYKAYELELRSGVEYTNQGQGSETVVE